MYVQIESSIKIADSKLPTPFVNLLLLLSDYFQPILMFLQT